MAQNKKNKQKLINEAYQDALTKIDKVRKNVDLKISNRKSANEKDQINSILDKINSQF